MGITSSRRKRFWNTIGRSESKLECEVFIKCLNIIGLLKWWKIFNFFCLFLKRIKFYLLFCWHTQSLRLKVDQTEIVLLCFESCHTLPAYTHYNCPLEMKVILQWECFCTCPQKCKFLKSLVYTFNKHWFEGFVNNHYISMYTRNREEAKKNHHPR